MSDLEQQLAADSALYADFIDGFDSLMLATVDAQGNPLASYAPYVRDTGGDFYVFVSRLAEHAANLLAQGRASVMFIESETTARQPFARKRAVFSCDAAAEERTSALGRAILDRFRARFGEVIGVLEGLADFELVRLRPHTGRFVVGFGRAYRLGGPGFTELQPIGPGEG